MSNNGNTKIDIKEIVRNPQEVIVTNLLETFIFIFGFGAAWFRNSIQKFLANKRDKNKPVNTVDKDLIYFGHELLFKADCDGFILGFPDITKPLHPIKWGYCCHKPNIIVSPPTIESKIFINKSSKNWVKIVSIFGEYYFTTIYKNNIPLCYVLLYDTNQINQDNLTDLDVEALANYIKVKNIHE